MTVVQIVGALRLYGADVLLIALGVTLLTSLIKRTLLKNFSGKVYVFLPFAIGVLIYACYRMIITLSAAPLTEELLSTCEGGFACGSVATIYYVVYEQFLRRGKTELSPLLPLLEGFVPEELKEAVADALIGGYKAVERENLPAFVLEALKSIVPELSDGDAELCSRLVSEFLLDLG